MRRFICKIFLFFFFIAIIDSMVGCIGGYLQEHAKGGYTKKTNDLVLKDNHDIVIFGSSRANHHYDTPYLSETLGLDVFNAGYDGNGVILSYGLLGLILERYSPRLIILDVEPAFDIIEYKSDNNHKRYIDFIKPYYRHPVIGNLIKDVSYEEWIKVHSGMMCYNSTLITKTIDNIKPITQFTKGFEPLLGVYDGDPEDYDNSYINDDFKLKYIESMIKIAKDNNIKIALVASPKYGASSSLIFQPVKEICKKHNVDFIDFYADMDFMNHKEWFKEPMHLNNEGARFFSSKVANRISGFIK